MNCCSKENAKDVGKYTSKTELQPRYLQIYIRLHLCGNFIKQLEIIKKLFLSTIHILTLIRQLVYLLLGKIKINKKKGLVKARTDNAKDVGRYTS